jgi:XTP/dITP diphosphohydrolase
MIVMKIIIATRNAGKIKEIKELLLGLKIEIIGATEFGISREIREDGKTFEENALIKARQIANWTGLPALADDSGIMIRALNGKPGVFSARWAGPGATDDDLVRHTLKKMEKIPRTKRQASFYAAVALVLPTGQEWLFTGEVKGRIGLEAKGRPRPGLAYDAIFIPAGFSQTFGEMNDAQKNRLSHRAQALGKLKVFLAANINKLDLI